MQVEFVQQQPKDTVNFASHPQRLRLKDILVPTDFSDLSLKALAYGVAMARQFGANLWLLHSVEPTPPFTGLEGVPIALNDEQETTNAKRSMVEFAAKHIPSDVSVTSVVRHGSAVREIADLASTENIDLVIASTHHHDRVTRALFGGITERIIHRAPCPILIVREREHEFLADSASATGAVPLQIKRILAPIDFSDSSKKALRYATAFAAQFDAKIFCLHVLEPEKPLMLLETESYRKSHEIEAQSKMKDLLNEIDSSIQVESAIVSGSPHREIIDLADHKQVDLIILGEHCRTGAVGRFMLGSDADKVVKDAHCPILVVRRIEHEFVD